MQKRIDTGKIPLFEQVAPMKISKEKKKYLVYVFAAMLGLSEDDLKEIGSIAGLDEDGKKQL